MVTVCGRGIWSVDLDVAELVREHHRNQDVMIQCTTKEERNR